MTTMTRQDTAAPAYFPPFQGTEIGVTRMCVCGRQVQTRISGRTNRRYVACVETRPEWAGAYFRGIHTREECEAGYHAWQARIAAETAERETREATAAAWARTRTILDRCRAIYGQEWLVANFDACYARLTA